MPLVGGGVSRRVVSLVRVVRSNDLAEDLIHPTYNLLSLVGKYKCTQYICVHKVYTNMVKKSYFFLIVFTGIKN